MAEKYKLSGKTGNIWLVGFLLAIPISFVLSLVYTYINIYNPIVYFTVVVWWFYLRGITMMLKFVAKSCKCRSKNAIKIFGLLIGLISVYINWTCFMYAFGNEIGVEFQLVDLILSPSQTFNAMSLLAVDGWFEINGFSPKGGILWLIWLVETGGILGAGISGGLSVLHEEVFCEKSDSWAEDINYDVRLSIKDQESLNNAINGDVDTLFSYSLASEYESPHIRLNLHSTGESSDLRTLDFDRITLSRNKEGNIEEAEDLSPVFIITKEQFNRFQQKDFSKTVTSEEDQDGEEQTAGTEEQTIDAAPIEYTQVPKETASTFAKRSISIMLEYPIYFALCIVGLAVLDSSILQGVLDAYNVQGSLLQQNTQLVSVILTFMGLNLLKVILFGPLLSMMVVYLGFAFTQNKEVSPYNALNFILRNYKRLFVPFLIAQLCIQIGMVVVIPGVLFMMQYAFVDAVTCIEKNPGPLTRSRKLTRALRGSLLAFIIPWALFSQFSGLIILQFSDNFLALTSLNVVTQAFYTFIMCAFFSAYEYRSYKLAVRRADKERQATPERPLQERKNNPTIGWLVGIAIAGFCSVSIAGSLTTQNYISCVDTKVQQAFMSSSTTSSTFNASSVCESAKKTCSPTPPCEMACNITKYNLKHPKDMTKPYTMQGAPNIAQCTP